MIKNNIKVERAKLNITQAELAKRVSVTRQTINSIENGKFVPSVELALKIAKTFETRVDDVFQLTDDNF